MTGELTESQLEAFDSHYVNDERWALAEPLIRERFSGNHGERPFVVLDVGGGNGTFADRIIDGFDQAHVTVAEPAASLRCRNAPHPRKRCVETSADDLVGSGLHADLICFNWVLHHLVADSYQATRRRIRTALRDAATLLHDDGRVSVYENNYNGRAIADLPGWATYRALRSPLVSKLAARAGANTAGVGVCFLSRAGWHRMFRSAGLEVVSDKESTAHLPVQLARSRAVRTAIGLREIRIGHYWLRRSGSGRR